MCSPLPQVIEGKFWSLQYLFRAMLSVQHVSAEGVIRSSGMEEQTNFRLLSLQGLLEKERVSPVVLLSLD